MGAAVENPQWRVERWRGLRTLIARGFSAEIDLIVLVERFMLAERSANRAQVETPWATEAAVILSRSAHTAEGCFTVCRDHSQKRFSF